MQKVTKYPEILNLIAKVKKINLGFVTNFYYDESKANFLAANNRLFYEKISDSFFIIRKHLDFFYLFFIAPGYEKLETSLKHYLNGNQKVLVVDLLGKGDYLLKLSSLFERNNFDYHETLIRMSIVRKPGWISGKEIDPANYATIEDEEIIYEFLKDRLDKYSEQIPLIEEIRLMIKCNQLLVIKNNNEIAGLLYFEKNGLTSHLKEWHVNEKYRNMKIGSKLLNQYFDICSDSSRFILWVKENNQRAIEIYKHYGYTKELISDRILLYDRRNG